MGVSEVGGFDGGTVVGTGMVGPGVRREEGGSARFTTNLAAVEADVTCTGTVNPGGALTAGGADAGVVGGVVDTTANEVPEVVEG